MAANEALFSQATTVLKIHAQMLQGMADQLNRVVADEAIKARIAGHIAQAAALVTAL